MILKAVLLGLEMGGKAVAIMNSQDAERLEALGLARVTIRIGMAEQTAIAHCPKDSSAGIFRHKKLGDVVNIGEPLFSIYSERSTNLQRAMGG